MIRPGTFLLIFLLQQATPAQIPPGDPYDASRHVNPVITFVEVKDFKPSTLSDAEKNSGVTLLGLSKDMGSLNAVDLAPAARKKVRSERNPVRFSAVARQTFKLSDGATLYLYSFKMPDVPIPSIAQLMEYYRSLSEKKRFGGYNGPEELQIRGNPGLLFEKDGQITVVWQEGKATYTADSDLSRKELFRYLNDLL